MKVRSVATFSAFQAIGEASTRNSYWRSLEMLEAQKTADASDFHRERADLRVERAAAAHAAESPC